MLQLARAAILAAVLAVGCAHQPAPCVGLPEPDIAAFWPERPGTELELALNRSGFATVFELSSAGALSVRYPTLDGLPEKMPAGTETLSLVDPVLKGRPSPRRAQPISSSFVCQDIGTKDNHSGCLLTHIDATGAPRPGSVLLVMITDRPVPERMVRQVVDGFVAHPNPAGIRHGVSWGAGTEGVRSANDVAKALAKRLSQKGPTRYLVVRPTRLPDSSPD